MALILAVVVALSLTTKTKVSKRKYNRRRRWWIRPINCRKEQQSDYYENLYQETRQGDRDSFFNYTRMSVEMFDELLQLLKPHMTKRSNRPSIPAECRLLITLRLVTANM